MPSKKRKPKPLAPPPLRSRKRARQLTTRFHQLQGALDQLEAGGGPEAEKARLRAEIHAMGGREAYQQASQRQIALCDTSRFVFQTLERMGKRPSGRGRLRVVEIGAVTRKLLDCRWMDTTSMDIEARHEGILEVDFFDFACEEPFDVGVCAMVLNCVAEKENRGRMLRKLRGHLRDGALMFLVLPRRCVQNSPHLDEADLLGILRHLGFALERKKESPKIVYYACTAVDPGPAPPGRARKRKKNDVCDFDIAIPV